MRVTITHTPDSPLSPDLSDFSDEHLARSTNQQKNQRKASQWLYSICAIFAIMLMSGCGPEPDASNNEALIAETERIAQEYTAGGDIGRAKAALDSLSVANSNQWLVYVTESRISRDPNSPVTTSLVRFSLDLQLTSAAIEQQAVQVGLLAPTPPVVAQAVAPVIQSTPAVVEPAPAAPASVEESAPPTAVPVDEAEAPTSAAPADPVVSATDGINVRSGPGTTYQIVGALEAGQVAPATGKSPAGDWWQILLSSGQQGWVLGQLVTTSGDFAGVGIPADIPAPPPPPTAAPPTNTPVPEVVAAPTEPPRSGNDFVMIEKRLWSADENGGRMDGPSVVCGEKRELHVTVVDGAGNLLNGVAVQAQYGAKEIFVTGAQGKGEGKAEFVLGDGQDVKVVKAADGRDVTSDLAAGLVTIPGQIPFENLIASGYCTDNASCQKNVVDPYACGGHFSWSVTFKQNY